MFAQRSGWRRWGAASVLLTVLIGGWVIGLTRESTSVAAQSSPTASESVVVLVQTGKQFYPVVQALYALTGRNFNQSVRWAKLTPSVVLRTSDTQTAARVQAVLQTVGASVEIDPFYMTVENVTVIRGRGLLVTGPVGRGNLSVREAVELVGLRVAPIKSLATDVQRLDNPQAPLKPGDRLGVMLSQVNEADVKRGMLLVKAGTLAARTLFQAEIYVTTITEGGQGKAIARNAPAQFRLWNTDYTGALQLPAGTTNALPGGVTEVTVMLNTPAPVENGSWFTIYQQNRPIGFGIVSAPLK